MVGRNRSRARSTHRSASRPDFWKKTCSEGAREEIMLWTIVAVCLILWLLGFSLSLGGSLIHLLLVVALVVFVVNLVNGRRGAV